MTTLDTVEWSLCGQRLPNTSSIQAAGNRFATVVIKVQTHWEASDTGDTGGPRRDLQCYFEADAADEGGLLKACIRHCGRHQPFSAIPPLSKKDPCMAHGTQVVEFHPFIHNHLILCC